MNNKNKQEKNKNKIQNTNKSICKKCGKEHNEDIPCEECKKIEEDNKQMD